MHISRKNMDTYDFNEGIGRHAPSHICNLVSTLIDRADTGVDLRLLQEITSEVFNYREKYVDNVRAAVAGLLGKYLPFANGSGENIAHTLRVIAEDAGESPFVRKAASRGLCGQGNFNGNCVVGAHARYALNYHA